MFFERRISMKCSVKAAERFNYVDVTVEKVNLAKNIIIFKKENGRLAEGDFVNWVGQLKKIPQKGDLVKGGALWNDKWIEPFFYESSNWPIRKRGFRILRKEKLGVERTVQGDVLILSYEKISFEDVPIAGAETRNLKFYSNCQVKYTDGSINEWEKFWVLPAVD
jgi:hypothetical protein